MNALAEPAVASSERAELLELINASWTTQAICAACVLRLPETLAAGALGADALAEATGCHAPSLARLMRALVTLGVCDFDDAGRYRLTAVGELLREDHALSVRAWALLAGGPIWQRWSELDQSVRSGSSHRRRHGGVDGFEDLGASAAAAALFYQAMVAITRPIAAAVADAIDPAGVQRVVDVGGGSGELLAQVLAAHPSLHGVLFDLPHGLEGATAVLERAGVAARCTRVAGSFFDTMPEGAELYLLKSVLHNWDDARCVQILRGCRSAMAPQGRVLVIERVMSERPGCTRHDRAVARSDLNMLVALSGRERTVREFAALFAQAGLVLERDLDRAGEFTLLQLVAA
jgi:orsellinic acid C2-O-methyltransferase